MLPVIAAEVAETAVVAEGAAGAEAAVAETATTRAAATTAEQSATDIANVIPQENSSEQPEPENNVPEQEIKQEKDRNRVTNFLQRLFIPSSNKADVSDILRDRSDDVPMSETFKRYARKELKLLSYISRSLALLYLAGPDDSETTTNETRQNSIPLRVGAALAGSGILGLILAGLGLAAMRVGEMVRESVHSALEWTRQRWRDFMNWINGVLETIRHPVETARRAADAVVNGVTDMVTGRNNNRELRNLNGLHELLNTLDDDPRYHSITGPIIQQLSSDTQIQQTRNPTQLQELVRNDIIQALANINITPEMKQQITNEFVASIDNPNPQRTRTLLQQIPSVASTPSGSVRRDQTIAAAGIVSTIPFIGAPIAAAIVSAPTAIAALSSPPQQQTHVIVVNGVQRQNNNTTIRGGR